MMILSELCALKRTRKLFEFIKIICTDLLCWIYFVPLCSGSGDESLSLYKCQQAEKKCFLRM